MHDGVDNGAGHDLKMSERSVILAAVLRLLSGSRRSAPLYWPDSLFFVGVASSRDKIAARCRFHPQKKQINFLGRKLIFLINPSTGGQHD
jgi:hypothetical protein